MCVATIVVKSSLVSLVRGFDVSLCGAKSTVA